MGVRWRGWWPATGRAGGPQLAGLGLVGQRTFEFLDALFGVVIWVHRLVLLDQVSDRLLRQRPPGRYTVHVTAPGRAYRVLLTEGTLYTTGTQLANVSVVLPFICAQEGYNWAAGLLYPAYCVGIVGGNSLSPYVLARARHLKHLVIATTTLLMASLVVISAFSAWTKLSSPVSSGGVAGHRCSVGGVSKVAFSEVVSSKLEDHRRSDLELTQGAIGAILAIGPPWCCVPFLAQRDPAHSHLGLLWPGLVRPCPGRGDRRCLHRAGGGVGGQSDDVPRDRAADGAIQNTVRSGQPGHLVELQHPGRFDKHIDGPVQPRLESPVP